MARRAMVEEEGQSVTGPAGVDLKLAAVEKFDLAQGAFHGPQTRTCGDETPLPPSAGRVGLFVTSGITSDRVDQ